MVTKNRIYNSIQPITFMFSRVETNMKRIMLKFTANVISRFIDSLLIYMHSLERTMVKLKSFSNRHSGRRRWSSKSPRNTVICIGVLVSIEFVHLTCLPKRNNFRPRNNFFVRPPDNPAASSSFIFGVTGRRFYGQISRNLLHWLASIHIWSRIHYALIDWVDDTWRCHAVCYDRDRGDMKSTTKQKETIWTMITLLFGSKPHRKRDRMYCKS